MAVIKPTGASRNDGGGFAGAISGRYARGHKTNNSKKLSIVNDNTNI